MTPSERLTGRYFVRFVDVALAWRVIVIVMLRFDDGEMLVDVVGDVGVRELCVQLQWMGDSICMIA
jgi:hypothetical protein